MSKWILASHRLPNPYEMVIVYACGRITTDFLTSSGRWYNRDGVTHWRPMPEAPKDESEDAR